MQDVEATIVSEYSNSPVINALIQDFNAWIDPSADFNSFYVNIWNLATAVGYGLDLWGRILCVGRVIAISNGTQYFGSSQATDQFGFGQAAFYSSQPLTQNYALSDQAYRLLLMAKAMTNVCDGSIPAINQILLTLFPSRGDIYVTDGQNMTMTFTSSFILQPWELAVLQQPGILPRPTGVAATVVEP
jgi:hypothetical protein